MKFIFSFISFIFLLFSIFQNSYAGPFTAKIHIVQITSHPSLDLIVQGVISALKEGGYENFSQENAQGNLITALQIAQKVAAEKPDVVIAISTPSAQTLQKALQGTQIPLIFGGVTDPQGANLVKNLKQPEGLITGTIDLPDPKDQVALMQRVLPTLKTLGIIYNSSEPNTILQLKGIKNALTSKNLKSIEVTVSKSSEVQAAALSLTRKVQALLILNDNAVVSALPALLKVSQDASIPLFASDPQSVEKGAWAALANDQVKVGEATGKLALRVLEGEKIRNIPVERITPSQEYLNSDLIQKSKNTQFGSSLFDVQ